ncbi:zf-HC2 domain-containing protein [uncultured Draconibacterium sp.]|uniref:zf-HC2 domain-containing protein n=1 Tax=uncultured Draconibacterium sp. TaxID=1573823 RepID=UPI003216F9E2
MKCKTVHNNLIFFLEKELPVLEMKQVQEHLDTCPDCALFAEEMKKTLSILETEKATENNPFLYTRIKAKLENQEEAERIQVARPILIRVLQPVAFSVLLLLGIYGGIKMGNVGSPVQETSVLSDDEMIPFWNGMDSEPIESFLLK